MFHMKNQVLYFSKDKSKKLKCRLLQFLFGALRVNPDLWPGLPEFSVSYHLDITNFEILQM